MFKVHAKRVTIFAILGLLAGVLIARNLPKMYQARTDLLIDSPRIFEGYDPTILPILTRYNPGNVETEMSVLASDGLFEMAMSRVAVRRNRPDLLANSDQSFKMYQVEQGGKDSKVVLLTFKANDPQLAADTLNEVTAFYNEFREQKTKEAMASGQKLLQQRVAESYKDMKRTESKLTAFKREFRITDPQIESTQLAQYQSQLTEQRDTARAELAAMNAQIGSQRAKLQVLPQFKKTSVNRVQTAMVAEYKDRLAKLQADRLTALEKYQPTSARIQEFDRLIAQMQGKLQSEMNQQWEESSQSLQVDPIRAQLESSLAVNEALAQSLQAKVTAATGLLDATLSKIQQLPPRDEKYNQYQREFDIRQKQYLSYLSMQEDLKRKIDNTTGTAIALFPALADERPVGPDVLKLGIVGLIAGIIVGILGSFLMESLRLPVRTSGQLAELTGLPVAATVPLMARRAATRMLAGLPDPNAKPSESFRFMAFSQLAKEGGAPKLVLFTGIGGSVGCSSAAAQYALATAKTGVKTLLVDCDLRHPALTLSFDAGDQSGVSDMLNRTMLASESADISLETPHSHLRLVTAGTEGEDGLADYPTSHIVGIMNHLAEKADIVVLDAPPCDIVADAARLVPYVDLVCLVVSAQSTSFRSVPMAYDILKRCGAKDISLILTHASPQDEPFSKKTNYLAAA